MKHQCQTVGREQERFTINLPLSLRCDPSHLMIQHEQEGALDVEVSRPFHLEAICFLGGGHPMPLAGRKGA